MARSNPLLLDFSGEAGPRFHARADFDGYTKLCEVAENLICTSQGALVRRGGTRYISETKNSANESHLLSFEYNTEESYIIEAGTNYFRFYTDQAQIVIAETDASITNGTFDSDVSSWTDQSGAGSSISHDSTFNMMAVTSNGTTDGHAEQSVSVGASYTAVTHVLRFRVASIAGDYIRLQVGTTSTGTELIDEIYGAGWHTVSFTPGATTIYVQFVNDRAKSILIDDVEFLSDQALELVTPYSTDNIDTAVTPQTNDVMYIFVGGFGAPRKLLRYGNLDWSLETVEFIDGPYLDQNIDNILPANATVGLNVKRSTKTGSATTLAPSATTGLGITITASSTEGINNDAGFNSNDIGRLVRIQQSASADAGYAVITSINSTTVAVADVRRDFNVTTATTRWWLGAFSINTGYPSVATFFQQRLVVGNTSTNPQSIMFSQSGDIENMRPDSFVSSALTVEDDDAMNFTIASTQANIVRWLEASRNLVLGTSGGEWVFSSQGAALSPTDFTAERRTTKGSIEEDPALVNDNIVFIQKNGKKIYDYRFVFEADNFQARDLTEIAHHIAGSESAFEQLMYAQEPDSILYGLRSDGVLASLTYKPESGKVGWTRQKLGGTNTVVESMAVIPGQDGGGRTLDSGDRDEVWLLVSRTINGATVRYIEVLENVFEGPYRHDYSSNATWETAMLTAQQDAFYVDCGLTYDGAAATSITGLDHLEGEVVKVLADGGIHRDLTVSSGAITLDQAASKVHIGLGYAHRYLSLKLPYGAVAGTAIGKTKRMHEVTYVVMDTCTFYFGTSLDVTTLEVLEFRDTEDAMDTAVPLFTGERRQEIDSDWSLDTRLSIYSNAPSAFTLLAVAPEMNTQDMK